MPKTASLDDDSLFTTKPQPVPDVPQRGTVAVPRPIRPTVAPEAPAKLVDLNFKVDATTKRRVKDLAYKLDCKHVEVLRRALDSLERELAK